MDAKQIVTEIMKLKGINQTQLAKLVGFKNQSNVSETLKRDIKISIFARMVDALGYEVVIRKKNTGRKGDGVFVLEVEQK